MKSEQPRVAIVILNWNGKENITCCLDSIRWLDYPNYMTIVVDNGSGDGSQEVIRTEYSEVTLIENGSNLGFVGGNNVGIERAMQDGVDYVLLLNNDTVVDAGLLTHMLEGFQSDGRFGIIGPKIYFYDRPRTLWFGGGSHSLHLGTTRHLQYGLVEDDEMEEFTIEETDFVTGCALMASREAFETIGLLDPDYFLCWEDIDFCARAQRAGFKLGWSPAAKVWHKVAGDLGGMESPRYLYYRTRNRLIFMRKHVPRKVYWVPFLAHFGLSTTRILLTQVLRFNWKGVAATLQGIYDFARGRYGEGM